MSINQWIISPNLPKLNIMKNKKNLFNLLTGMVIGIIIYKIINFLLGN